MKDTISTIWYYLRNAGYLFIIFILGWVLFNSLAQSRDFVSAFILGPEWQYYLSVAVLLFFWSYMTWYSASIILEINPDNHYYTNLKSERVFCRVIGLVPIGIIALTFFKAQDGWKQGLGAVVLGALVWLFFSWRDKLNTRPGKWPKREEVHGHNLKNKLDYTPTFWEEIKFLRQYPNVWYYFKVFGLALFVLTIAFCFPKFLITTSRMLRPAAVVILALSFFTWIFTVAFYFHDFKTRPFVFYSLIWLVIVSKCNDNTKIPIIQSFKEGKDFRLTPKEAFEKWYTEKREAWDKTHKPTDSMPVVFIATQGGGIRGEIWTSDVLHYLQQDTLKDFYNQIFCMGGASGGTVGAVYYTAFVYDSLHKKTADTMITFRNFRKFTEADCLSPVTASFVFGENVQHVLPFPVAGLERAKVTMKAFSSSYEYHLGSGLTETSFLSMYYPNDDPAKFNCKIPSLFINGTLAETGQRVITSDLKLTASPYFSNDIDFFNKVKGHITIAAASLNCMRFPLLLSGGLFYDQKSPDLKYSIGHIVDGGYLENTGLQAMYSLMTELWPSLVDSGRYIKPILIYLRNGGFEYTVPHDSTNTAFGRLHDLKTPFETLVNVNGTSVPSLGVMKMIDEQQANGNPMKMYATQVWLKDSNYRNYLQDRNDTFPLGLYISDSTASRLHRRADSLLKVNRGLMDTLHHYFR